MTFDFSVRYSNHCYSKELLGAVPDGASTFLDSGGKGRLFCPDRYLWSQELPEIVEGLFVKPTSQVKLTIEGNWYVFQLHMKAPLPHGETYYCFLRMRHHGTDDGGLHKMSLQVESAYSRNSPPLSPHGNERSMFGRLAERLATK